MTASLSAVDLNDETLWNNDRETNEYQARQRRVTNRGEADTGNSCVGARSVTMVTFLAISLK